MPYSRRDSRHKVRTEQSTWDLVHAKSKIIRNAVHRLLMHFIASNGTYTFAVASLCLTTGTLADSMDAGIKRERTSFVAKRMVGRRVRYYEMVA